jgi:hypothetical protein
VAKSRFQFGKLKDLTPPPAISRGVRQQDVGADEIVGLSGGEVKPCRIAQGIHRGVDLRTQSAAATSDGLAYSRHLLDGSGTVLVSTNDGGINHDLLVVRILRQSSEYALPDPRLAPAREPGVHHAEVPETLGQVAPRHACSSSVQHRFYKQAVVYGGDPNVPNTPRQQIFDAFPLVVSQCVPLFHRFTIRRSDSAQRA